MLHSIIFTMNTASEMKNLKFTKWNIIIIQQVTVAAYLKLDFTQFLILL